MCVCACEKEEGGFWGMREELSRDLVSSAIIAIDYQKQIRGKKHLPAFAIITSCRIALLSLLLELRLLLRGRCPWLLEAWRTSSFAHHLLEPLPSWILVH